MLRHMSKILIILRYIKLPLLKETFHNSILTDHPNPLKRYILQLCFLPGNKDGSKENTTQTSLHNDENARDIVIGHPPLTLVTFLKL